MTTTRSFQSRQDFYMSQSECEAANRRHKQRPSNPRYIHFKQTHFTAGDEQQFQTYRDATNGDVCIPNIDVSKNLFVDQPFSTWDKYKDVGAESVIGTFRYIFHKFKKGIFIKIKNNKLVVFLPFSKANFKNEWYQQIHIDPRYRKRNSSGDLDTFLKAFTGEGYRYNPQAVNHDISEWYANNCIVRYDINSHTRKVNERDTNVGTIKNMIETLCKERKVPDIEFFVNRRDFPILKRDFTEPYDNIWGDDEKKLVSYNLPKYLPILSMCKTERYADVLIPTHEDWTRVQNLEGIWFPRNCKDYNTVFDIPWEKKKRTAVFRGASTGCGVTIKTNPRLHLAYLSSKQEGNEKEPLLDAGITKWNLRPRKLKDSEFLQSIEVDKMGLNLVNYLTPQEQAGYKYIINVDGHVSAFRLSMELGMGSVILLVESEWKIWYSDMLIPYTHYVPIKRDLSDLIKQIHWCRNNDGKCETIAANAMKFFKRYIQKKGALDYLQKTLVDLKSEIGVYLYNEQSPMDIQLKEERRSLSFSYPETNKTVDDIHDIPWTSKRSFGLLQGIHWVINLALHRKQINMAIKKKDRIFSNKSGVINKYTMGREILFPLVVKKTEDAEKSKEHIHEAFVGIKAINHLLKSIPNFAYTFGVYQDHDNSTNLINEFIEGPTLFDYLQNKDKFSMNQFCLILVQVCLAVQVAQNRCGLVHYDLVPWNIILQPNTNRGINIDYVINKDNIIRVVQTDLVPVIIDYGKSHVIVNQKHHGFVNMFKVSTIQDVLSLLLNSIKVILKSHNTYPNKLERRDFNAIMHLANFVAGTKYREGKFQNIQDLKNFLRHKTRYAEMAYGPKYELEKRTPMDLMLWIGKLGRIYPFTKKLKKVNERNKTSRQVSSMDKGNGRQVFEYILSGTTEERAQTYFNVFSRLKHCTIPQPKNLFFVYYVVQELSRNLMSINDEMRQFLQRTNKYRLHEEPDKRKPGNPVAYNTYIKAYEDSLIYLEKVYRPKIEKMKEENIEYKIEGDFSSLQEAPYTQETFLNPSSILHLLKNYNQPMTDLSTYQEIITSILLDNGKYRLDEIDRKYYLKNFDKLLSVNPLIMQNNTTNLVTLRWMASKIYSTDQQYLSQKLPAGEGNCASAQRYLKKYTSILKYQRRKF